MHLTLYSHSCEYEHAVNVLVPLPFMTSVLTKFTHV